MGSFGYAQDDKVVSFSKRSHNCHSEQSEESSSSTETTIKIDQNH
jgi:hypothetical protein